MSTPGRTDGRRPRLMFVVTEDWYFVSHRLALAVAARDAGYEVSVATRVQAHGGPVEAAGIRVHPLDFNRSGLNPFEDLGTLSKLVGLYRRERPDIVHHVAMKPVIYGSLAARLAGVRGVVNALAGFGFAFSAAGARGTALRAVARTLLKLALGGGGKRLIVQNDDARRQVIDGKLARPETIRLIGGAGVDTALYRERPSDADPPLAILPARLLRDKGVLEFIEAVRILRGQEVPARYALVGRPDPANPASATQAEVDAWAAEGLIEAWGWREDMPAVYGQAQIVCLPSHHEGLPRTLLEAAAGGCALVATDIPGCREIVRAGETGWLVPPRNPPALAAALREAIERPDLRRVRGSAARALVEREFSLARVVAETLAVYRELQS